MKAVTLPKRVAVTVLSVFLCVLAGMMFGVFTPVWSQDCTVSAEYCDIQNQISDLQRQLDQSRDATKPLEKTVAQLDAQIKSTQNSINAARKKADALAVSIEERENTLAYQYTVFSQRVNESYRRMLESTPLLIFFSSTSASDLTRELAYRSRVETQDQDIIHSIGEELLQLEQDKKKLEEDQARLAKLQAQLDIQAEYFRKEIDGAKKFQQELSGKIASLSARQQQILAEKTATTQTTVGEVPLSDDPASRPTYDPGFSPAFAAFSFGAPHFKGMSQYGAYGRAQAGQNEEEILKAYYGNVRIETVDTGGDINTTSGSMSFEDRYLMGIAEMPSSWDANNLSALKAQAIAARSYAMAYAGWRMGDRSFKSSICTTESCQVWSSSKAGSPPDNWKKAVEETRGKIVVGNDSNEVVNTWYASTSGGYQQSYTSLGHTTPAFWDSTSDWTRWADGAYEAKAGSPWFYKGWYKFRSGDSCGRSHPWLTSTEMADILNAWTVRTKGGASDVERVSPLGGCWGGNPFSVDEMRQKAKDLGKSYSSVSSIRVEHGNNGYTTSVILGTDNDEVTMTGSDFKTIFNLRAPARISIKGNLFSIEKK